MTNILMRHGVLFIFSAKDLTNRTNPNHSNEDFQLFHYKIISCWQFAIDDDCGSGGTSAVNSNG